MSSISSCLKHPITIAIAALGLIIAVGKWGHRFVNWIIELCSTAKKTDKVGKDAIADAALTKLKMPDPIDPKKIIENGYGEFVVSRSEEATKLHGKITDDTYRKVYAIFQKFQPTSLSKSNPDNLEESYAQRQESIQTEVAAIDPSYA